MPGYLRMSDGQEHQIDRVEHPIECFRCGICCTRYQPKLASEELKNIASQLSLSVADFIGKYVIVTQVGYLVKQAKKGCIFLRWSKDGARATCSIYSFRPAACRNWTPSLSHPECREGLVKLGTDNKIALPQDVFDSGEAAHRFLSSLQQGE